MNLFTTQHNPHVLSVALLVVVVVVFGHTP
jgi:hypothetical protein